ncbi:MAG: alanine racemase [Rhodospirillaceae bacterium]|jgi:alanine racemase|nr:alanine racemase [Rhodospirillaceae bacterium]MBT5780836.1 alanine racemase [Rhodospirillaceae bacterium]MBT7291955.1 alanine racemase [Rhodospirillaceae bacterium]
MPATAFAGAHLTINLDAITANWRALGARLKGGALAAAVIKANAYGLGMAAVAPALHKAGCREFFVASLDEAIALRAILPEGRIYVFFGPSAQDAAEYSRHRLIPVLNDLGQIDAWRARSNAGEGEKAVLHVDTGMSRLGLPPDEVALLVAEPARLAGLNIAYVMSHLACAEQPGHAMNAAQLAEFKVALESLGAHTANSKASLANSSAIFLGPEYHFDLARPGAALYGLNPTPDQPNPMSEVVRLQGKILQVRRVDSSRSVGYGAAHVAERPSRIATVPVGYADGYLRSASNQAANQACGYIRGARAPVVGRVSMDMITLDVTDIPQAHAHPGAAVDLIGGPYPVDRFAADAGTIGYEILTMLGQRYRRLYVEDGKQRIAAE